MRNSSEGWPHSIGLSWRRGRLGYYINKLRFFGLKYECPICGSRLRRFRPAGRRVPVLTDRHVIGGGYRPNGRCPVCLANDRARLIYLYLLRKTNLFSAGAKLLHVAPESGLSRIMLQHGNIDYLTADISSDSAMVKMDITKIGYPDGFFDVIICNHVLEHVIDDRRAMRELYRVLRPGGWGILQVPISQSLDATYEDFSVTDPAERERVFGQADHVRIYAIDYPDRLRASGFETSVFDWQEDDTFGGSDNRYGLLPNERVFAVRRPEQPRQD